MLDIELRAEEAKDYFETENMTREAFWNHFVPGCAEHYLIHILRKHKNFVPELDIVALHNGKIVGNIAYLKEIIKGDDGKDYEVLLLGPISVLPEYQRKGVGSKLIEYTKNLARKMNFRAIILYGDPAYYSKQGFLPAEQFSIRTVDNMYIAAFQVFELYENALSTAKGRYIIDPVYNIDVDNSLVSEFDKKFPLKEKIGGTPSQKRFEEVVAMKKSAL